VEATQKQDAFAVHEGCECADNQGMAAKYFKDAAYHSPRGDFQWKQVPWSDLPALEVLVKRRLLMTGDVGLKSTDADKEAKPEDLALKPMGEGANGGKEEGETADGSPGGDERPAKGETGRVARGDRQSGRCRRSSGAAEGERG